METMGRLFGTDGVRGVVNRELTPDLALRLGEAIGTWLPEGSRILVGRDVRRGGEMIVRALTAGLLSAGAEPWYAGLAPTPALQYAVKALGYDAGVIVTASHNPPEYNGVKVVAGDGVEIPRSAEAEIEEIFFSTKTRRTVEIPGGIGREDRVIDTYIEAVLGHVDAEAIRRRGFRVLVDPANSVASLTLPKLLKRLGVKVYTFNGHLDPDFPGRLPEPTPETLGETAGIARELRVDLGVATDGDGDRAIFIDEAGRIWWGDRTAALLAEHIAEKHGPGRVYTAVSSSSLVEEYLKPLGIEVHWTPVGSLYISRSLIGEGGIYGFEENGGHIYPYFHPVRDSAIATALHLELLAKKDSKASELYARLPEYHLIKTKIPMPREKARRAVELVREKYAHERQVNIDGVKVIGDDYWFLVRPSGTEPVLRIMVEAKTREKAERIAGELARLVG